MYPQAMTAAPSEPLTRLGQYVERRIAELALEYAEVCRRARISDETLSKIRKGIVRARSSTYWGLERALQWEQGSAAAILAGNEPTLIEAASEDRSDIEPPERPAHPGLPPNEALRRVIRASARELGVTRDGLETAFRLAREDLQDLPADSGRTDLSDMVRKRRLAAGLSLEDVASRAVDPSSGEHVVDVDWLDRLERAALAQSEHPEYPQLDALVGVLHLDPVAVQDAAGVQFMDVHTVWSEDGQVRGLGLSELHGEDLAKAQALMRRYRRAPQRDV